MADERREVFFGLIAPIGINLDAVELTLSRSLERVNYKANNIRLTTIFAELGTKYEVKYTDEYDRYAKLIKAGDSLCKDAGRNDILALYGIEYLKLYQSRETNDEIPEQVAHIFRQIKRPEEIITLKEVFGRNAMFISCYSSKENRKDYLVKKLLKTNRGINKPSLSLWHSKSCLSMKMRKTCQAASE